MRCAEKRRFVPRGLFVTLDEVIERESPQVQARIRNDGDRIAAEQDKIARAFYARFDAKPEDVRCDAAAAANEMMAFQAARIESGQPCDTNLKSMIECGRR